MAINWSPQLVTDFATIGIGKRHATANARTVLALDSAYTHNASGDCLQIGILSPYAGQLTDVYVFSSALSGTPANIVYGVEVRNSTGVATAGNTLHASQNASASTTASTWTRITFSSPYTVAANEAFHIRIFNASSSPTVDFPTIVTGAGFVGSVGVAHLSFNSRTSTNGGSSTSGVNTSPVVLKIGSSVIGNPYTTTFAIGSSSTAERGILIRGSMIAKVKANGAILNAQGNLPSGDLKLIKASTLPGASVGAGEASASLSGTNTLCDLAYFAETELDANTDYRLVYDPSSATTRPYTTQIEDYSAFADVQNARPFNGDVIYTEESGGVFVDSEDRATSMALLISNVVAATGGSGGVPLIGAGGLVY